MKTDWPRAFPAFLLSLGWMTSATVVPGDFELRVMVIGASISAGQTGGGVLTNGYRKPLAGLLVNDGWEVDYVGTRSNGDMENNKHEGYPGIRTEALAKQTREKGVVEQFLPNLLLLNVGTNDCSQRVNATEARRIYTAMIDAVFAPAGQESRFLIASTLLPRREQDAGLQSCTAVFNDVVRDLVLTHPMSARLGLADMNTGFITVDDLAPGDNLHPSEEGFVKMADVWHDAIVTNMDRLTPPE
ncbi:hypothetical protein PpBr36_02702 [Pyricularia pennisetigena]|uniref:hypothetical protein n=1 Tax=Pyricularia pennisetigena TaxID=1578925 RepID=UPI001150A405|nr:hypothetical protein PpBr36_02702 [Pyricularia pennisetigena]TLS31462.1 hypothetical protein PpBr36_02702 [Pyricularia pennisetigena]